MLESLVKGMPGITEKELEIMKSKVVMKVKKTMELKVYI